MDEETRRYVEEWERKLDRADRSANIYRNLRLGALTFTILGVGALLAFGWNAGFQYAFECTTLYQKLLRFLVILLLIVVGRVYLPLEREFNRRYRLSWQKARLYEMALGDFDGLHTQIQRVILIRVPRSILGRVFTRTSFGRSITRFFSALVDPPSSLRRVIALLAIMHLFILSTLVAFETYNWISQIVYPTVCSEKVFDKGEKMEYEKYKTKMKQHRSLQRRRHERKSRGR